jgi:hypothetical protein
MRLLKALQIIDADGRLYVPMLLLILWILYILAFPAPGLFHAVMGIALIVNLQAERFIKSRDVEKLHTAELERIQKLETELGEIRGVLSIATQRTMF